GINVGASFNARIQASSFLADGSRLHTKRNIGIYFQGGDGVATYSNGIPALRCSTGFSAIHNETLQGYLITSARCLPSNTSEIYHAVWNSSQFHFFGVLRGFQLNVVNFALIEKLLLGRKVYISGYDSHVKCGRLIISNTHARLRPLRPGSNFDHFYNMIRAEIDVQLSNRDIGGTVFCMEYDETTGAVYLSVLCIVTHIRYVSTRHRTTITIQQFYRIIEQRLSKTTDTISSSPIQEHIPCTYECHKCKEPIQCTKSIKENQHFLNNNTIFYSNIVYHKKCLSDLSQTIQPLTTIKDNQPTTSKSAEQQQQTSQHQLNQQKIQQQPQQQMLQQQLQQQQSQQR
ncbi:12931_t:CDS:2, partial [Gigaspora rosea]